MVKSSDCTTSGGKFIMSQSTATGVMSDKLDFKRVLPIFIIVLVDLLGLTIIIPLLPLYAAAFGANPLTIGLLSAVFPIAQLLGAPILGGLSDKYGRRPVLMASQVGTFIGFVLLAFANSLPLLFLARLIDGATGGNIVVAQAAITDSTTERTRAAGLGMIGAAFGLGFTLGPALAGISLAVSNNNYHVPAFIAAGFSLLSIILSSFWLKETLPAEQRGKSKDTQRESLLRRAYSALTNPILGTLLALMFFQQLIFGGFEALLSLFTLTRLGMDGASNALLFVFVGIIIVLVQGKYIGQWSQRWGERKLIFGGMALLAVGLMVTAITPEQPVNWYSRQAMEASFAQSARANESMVEVQVSLPDEANKGWGGFLWILAAMVPASLGGAVLSPSINSLLTKRTERDKTGSVLGVSSALTSAANAVTPIMGGFIFQALGSTAPFLLGGALMAGLLFLALQYIKPNERDSMAGKAVAAGD